MMEKIKIKEDVYEIVSIMPISPNVLQIVFVDAVPDIWGDITTYTIEGMEAGCISGYDTVYRQELQTVYLSNDGSVYEPPEEPEITPPEPYEPTLEELKVLKKQKIAAACQQVIYKGVTVQLSDGTAEHF